jgi:Na+:H+ antiporter, NhaA family
VSDKKTLGGRVLPEPDRDHCQGPVTAKLSLVEYSDYECPPCAEAHWVVKELVEELGSEVCVVFRNLPLPKIHPRAQAAAEAAEAADAQGKFWLMHDRLLEHQDNLEPDDLAGYAREISLDMATFDRDLRSGSPARRVAEDVESAHRNGVTGTPTFFVNGTLFTGPSEFLPLLKALKGVDAGHDRFDA